MAYGIAADKAGKSGRMKPPGVTGHDGNSFAVVDF